MAARYTRTAALLHWTIAALILTNLVIGISHGAILSMRIHKAIGLTILAFSILRLGWRLLHPPPPYPSDIGRIERGLATWTHRLFYGLMIAVPLAGWAMVSNAPKMMPLTWFGLFNLPYLKLSPLVYGPAKEAHEVLAIGFGALLIGHVAAALRHHFITRDGLISRMSLAGPR